MTFTRTYTKFFASGDLADLDGVITRMTADWESRRGFTDTDTRAAGDTRLRLLTNAWHLANEPISD
jgi:hypothetical protein